MTKKDDGSFTFTATSGDFPKKHKAPVINIGIAETGMETAEALGLGCDFLVKREPLGWKHWSFGHSKGPFLYQYLILWSLLDVAF